MSNGIYFKIAGYGNFEVNLISHLGVIALFSSIFFLILILFVLYFKNYLEIDVKFKLQGYVDLDMLNMFAVSTYHLSLIVFEIKDEKY
jgi:hypothetical protein